VKLEGAAVEGGRVFPRVMTEQELKATEDALLAKKNPPSKKNAVEEVVLSPLE